MSADLPHVSEQEIKKQLDSLNRFLRKYFLREPLVEQNPWQPRMILPTKKSLNDQLQIIEVMGLSTAGKSSMLERFKEVMPGRFPDVHFIVVPEFAGDSELYKFLRERPFNNPFADGYLWSDLKFKTYLNAMGQAMDLMGEYFKQEKDSPQIVVVCERAMNDIVASDRGYLDGSPEADIARKTFFPHLSKHPAVAELFKDMDKQNFVYPSLKERMTQVTKMLIHAREVNATILFGGPSYEDAVVRRVQQGYDPEGYLVNPIMWPPSLKGYSWWLEYAYPKYLRPNFGMGVQVIDGRNDFDQNCEDVFTYVGKIISLPNS